MEDSLPQRYLSNWVALCATFVSFGSQSQQFPHLFWVPRGEMFHLVLCDVKRADRPMQPIVRLWLEFCCWPASNWSEGALKKTTINLREKAGCKLARQPDYSFRSQICLCCDLQYFCAYNLVPLELHANNG